jgi:hypothetical protein
MLPGSDAVMDYATSKKIDGPTLTRRQSAAIAALKPENAVAQEYVAKAEAAAAGNRDEARRHLQVARAAAERRR